MHWTASLKWILIFFGLISLSSCVTTKYPLSKYYGGDPDYQLLGLWYNQDDLHNQEYLHIVIDLNKHMHLIRVNHPTSNRGGRVSIDEFFMYRTKIGTRTYMNIRLQSSPGAPNKRLTQYFIVKYAVYSDDTLKVWTISTAAIEKAFKYGYLKGRVWRQNGKDYVLLESDQKTVRRWIINATNAEYNPPRVYKRIKKSPYREY